MTTLGVIKKDLEVKKKHPHHSGSIVFALKIPMPQNQTLTAKQDNPTQFKKKKKKDDNQGKK